MAFFERSLFATFFVIVPRKGEVNDLKDFKIISLMDGVYQLLAKVLANGIKKGIGSMPL